MKRPTESWRRDNRLCWDRVVLLRLLTVTADYFLIFYKPLRRASRIGFQRNGHRLHNRRGGPHGCVEGARLCADVAGAMLIGSLSNIIKSS